MRKFYINLVETQGLYFSREKIIRLNETITTTKESS